jgi:hypothetical protein
MIWKRKWMAKSFRPHLEREGISGDGTRLKQRWIYEREGWFLFGIIPLYIRDVNFGEGSK